MKKALPIILTGAAAIFLYFVSKANAAKKLKIYFRDLSTKKIPGQILPSIFVRFNINNGSNTPITVNSIVGDIFVNNNPLGSVSNFDKFTIAANSQSIYSVKIDAPITSIAQTVFNLFKKKQKFSVRFEGNVNSSGVLIPISQKLEL